MWPGDFEYSFGCLVDTCTLKLLVLWKLLPQCLQRTRSNVRGEAVEVGAHLTCLKCCFKPPFVNILPQWMHTESLGLFRGAISNVRRQTVSPSGGGIAVACARSTKTARENAHMFKG